MNSPQSSTCFMRARTHSYILLTQDEFSGRFLTIDSGQVTVETLERVDGVFKVGHEDLTPFPYDVLKAARVYMDSTLTKTPEALAELEALSGDTPRVTPQPAAPKPAKAVPVAKGGGYSLADLCKEAGIDPGEARQRLRKAKVQKPGGRWEWPNAEAAKPLLVYLK